jgi:tungstate transport system permease protein
LEVLWEAILQAFHFIITGDPVVMDIVSLSLGVSGAGLLLSMLIGIPLGCWLGLHRFGTALIARLGRRLIIALLYTGMGFPPVVVGLFVFLMLSRTGPFGGLGWLYDPQAIIVAQTIIAFPIIAGFTMAAVMGVNPELRQQLLSLGATSRQATLTILKEARVGVVVAIIAGFGSIISEVGAAMMVGGNITGHTRVMTTGMVELTRMGLFAQAMALGIILLLIAFGINLLMQHLQGRALD